MLPVAKKSAVRSTLLLGASALTLGALGVGANVVTPARALAYTPTPLHTTAGNVNAGSTTAVNTDFSQLSTSLSNVSNSVTNVSSSLSVVSNSVANVSTSLSNVSNSVTNVSTSLSNV